MKNIAEDTVLQAVKNIRSIRSDFNLQRKKHEIKSQQLNERFGYGKGDGAYAAGHTPLPALKENAEYMRESAQLNETYNAETRRKEDLKRENLSVLTVEEYFVYYLTELPFLVMHSDFEKILFSTPPSSKSRDVFERATILSAVGLEARLQETETTHKLKRTTRLSQLNATLKIVILESGWQSVSQMLNISSLNVAAKFKWRKLYTEYVKYRDFYLHNVDALIEEYALDLITPSPI